ncbi:Csu type fimbrial protein [Photobacterium ganghwense]|nr:spore coat U domain-containing protein [Photobacterium ganghwense]
MTASRVCCVWLLLLMAMPGIACELTAPTPLVQFGSVSSLTVNTAPQQSSAQPHAGITCDFVSVLSVLSGDKVSVRFTSNGAGQMKTKADSESSLAYQIFADSALSFKYEFDQTYNFFDAGLIELFDLFGKSAEFPLYVRTQANSNLSAGVYTDHITVSWVWAYCVVSVGEICIGSNSGSAQSTITLELTVTPDCIITAPDLNFGTAPLVAGFDPVNQTISLTCTKGSVYTVGLSDGQNSVSGQRRMAFGSDYLAYEIYKSSGTDRWGSTNGERRGSGDADGGAGSPDGITPQTFNYSATILTDQATPPPGIYTDSIVVDVQF